MKINLKWWVALLFIGLSGIACADVCRVMGYHEGNTYDGPTFCGQGQEAGITVNGTLTSTGTSFTDSVLVHGYVTSTDTHYLSGVSIASNSIVFSDTTSPVIEMLENGTEPQIIYLKKSSTIDSVVFDRANANNKVCLTDGSTVSKVTGGQVVENC